MNNVRNIQYIHIVWEGPLTLPDVYKRNKEGYDHGVYQVYGSHPVYGLKTLIYIGEARLQTFRERIKQEDWWKTFDDQSNVEIYIGRLAGFETPSDSTIDKQIEDAERLLIRAHLPAYNQRIFFSSAAQKRLSSIHVLNWENRGLLLPEVSGAFWTNKFDDPRIKTYGSI